VQAWLSLEWIKRMHHEHDTVYTGCHDISRSCVFDVEQERFERQTARGTGRVSKSRGVVFYKRIGTRSSEKTRLREKDILWNVKKKQRASESTSDHDRRWKIEVFRERQRLCATHQWCYILGQYETFGWQELYVGVSKRFGRHDVVIFVTLFEQHISETTLPYTIQNVLRPLLSRDTTIATTHFTTSSIRNATTPTITTAQSYSTCRSKFLEVRKWRVESKIWNGRVIYS